MTMLFHLYFFSLYLISIIDQTISLNCTESIDISYSLQTLVQSPGYPYINNRTQHCQWTIFSNYEGTAIQFQLDNSTIPEGVTFKIFSGKTSNSHEIFPNGQNNTKATVQSCVNYLTIIYDVNITHDAGVPIRGGFYGLAWKIPFDFSRRDCCILRPSNNIIVYNGTDTDCYTIPYAAQYDSVSVTFGDSEDYFVAYNYDADIYDHRLTSYTKLFRFSKNHAIADTHILFPDEFSRHRIMYFRSPNKAMQFSAVQGSYSEHIIGIQLDSGSRNGSYLYSPNYPEDYISGMSCAYGIDAGETRVAEITIEENGLGSSDTLTICKQASYYCSSSSMIQKRITWNTAVGSSYTSVTNQFAILFASKEYSFGVPKRFKLKLKSVLPRSQFDCNTTTDISGWNNAFLHSDGYPNISSGSQQCVWTMKVWPGTMIQLKIAGYSKTKGVSLAVFSDESGSGHVVQGNETITSCTGNLKIAYNVNISPFSGSIKGGFVAHIKNAKPDSSCCLTISSSSVSYIASGKNCINQIEYQEPPIVQISHIKMKFVDAQDYILGYTMDDTSTSGYQEQFRFSNQSIPAGDNLYLPYAVDENSYLLYHSPTQKMTFSGTISSVNDCHETITIDSGADEKYLYSPNYPSKYFYSMKCTYDVFVPSGRFVRITVEQNDLNLGDTVTICKDKESYYCFSRSILYSISSATAVGHSFDSTRNQISIFLKAADKVTGYGVSGDFSMKFKLKLESIKESMSAGTIVGIVVACLIGVALIIVIIGAVIWSRKNRNNRTSAAQSPSVQYAAYPTTAFQVQQGQYVQPQAGYGVNMSQTAPYPGPQGQTGQNVPGFQHNRM